jgi:hypothetical protein
MYKLNHRVKSLLFQLANQRRPCGSELRVTCRIVIALLEFGTSPLGYLLHKDNHLLTLPRLECLSVVTGNTDMYNTLEAL